MIRDVVSKFLSQLFANLLGRYAGEIAVRQDIINDCAVGHRLLRRHYKDSVSATAAQLAHEVLQDIFAPATETLEAGSGQCEHMYQCSTIRHDLVFRAEARRDARAWRFDIAAVSVDLQLLVSHKVCADAKAASRCPRYIVEM